jgi:hypothetical protein
MRGWLTRCILASLLVTGCRARAASDALAIRPDAAAIECVNPDSGFAWRLRLSRAASTVDGWPARFAAERISWHDRADGGFYELELATGALTIVRASSTGGYTSFDRCAAQPTPDARPPGGG